MKTIFGVFLSLFWLLCCPLMGELHPLTLHHPQEYHEAKNLVKLTDGSVWQVLPQDMGRMKEWRQSHEIVIRPVSSWFWPDYFIAYPYELYNKHSDSTIGVALKGVEQGEAGLPLFIQSIDRVNGRLVLSDDSCWETKSNSDLLEWEVGHSLLLGLKSDENEEGEFQILINATLPSFPHRTATGSCFPD